MNPSAIVLARMASQGLTPGSRHFGDPAELVAWMGCVQAQNFAMAKWGLGLRLGAANGAGRRGAAGSTDAGIDAVFNAGTILRTHVLRSTWHFVLPADIGWMLRLSAPRIKALSRPYHRQLEIDAAVLRRSRKVLERALDDGAFLTRTEIAALFRGAKVDTNDIRMGFLLMDAELEGLICSGPRKGKQLTFALLAHRVRQSLDLSGDEALGELARRFFRGRGPATVRDLSWWGGMTVGDAKRGLEIVKGELESEVFDGQTYWFGAAASPLRASGSSRASSAAFLLPAYDELTVAYKDRSEILPPEYAKASFNGLKPVIVVNGRIVGMWRRVPAKGKVGVELQYFSTVSKTVLRLVEREVERYKGFV